MKVKNIIIIVVVVIVLLIGGTIVLRKIKSKDIGGEVTGGSEVEVGVPEPIGQRKFDGNIDLFLKNKSGKEVEKIVVSTFGDGDTVVATDEFNKDSFTEDESNMIKVEVPIVSDVDADSVKWNMTVTIESKEYSLEDLVGLETFYDKAEISFDIENDKLVFVEE